MPFLTPILAAGFLLGGTAPTTPVPAVEGAPLVRNYLPKEHGGASQNWALVRDRRGVLYVGNNLGVLEYDGQRWRLIRTARGTTVRSLALDAEGRVWVGATGEIGYLAPDACGQMAFVDATGRIDLAHRAFSDVWVAAPTRLGLLFQCREALFLMTADRVRTIPATTTFHLAFTPGGRIFVRQREVGLQELTEQGLVLVPGGERFARESLFMVEDWEAGAYLLGSRNQGLWRFDGHALTPVRTDASAYLAANSLYNGLRLGDGRFALATLRGGVVLLDSRAQLNGILNRQNGLVNNNVKRLYADETGNLWMALDNGVAKAELPSPYSRFDATAGLEGIVWAVARHGGNLYAATGQGVFWCPLTSARPAERRFQPIPEIRSGSSGLLPMAGHLLAATSQGVFDLRGNRAQPVRPSSNVAISLLQSRAEPSRVFVGLQGGLASLRLEGNRWRDEGAIPGIASDIYSLAETEAGELWLGTSSDGVFQVSFPVGWRGGAQGGFPRIRRYGDRDGLPSAVQVQVRSVGGRILAGTKAGFFRLDPTGNRFVPDEGLKSLFEGGPRWVRSFRDGPGGRLWVDTEDADLGLREFGIAEPEPNGTYRWRPEPFRRLGDTMVESFLPESDGSLWFGTTEGILRWNASVPRDLAPAHSALVQRVQTLRGERLDSGRKHALPFTANGLRFEFALPFFDQESANQFRVRLDGYDREWSRWSPDAFKEYTNLPEGSYRFRVQGRNVYGQVSAEGTYAFRILPPWYRTWWAYLLLLAGSAGLLALGFRFRMRLLQRRNTILKRQIERATEDLREREQLLATQAGALALVNADLQTLNHQLQHMNEEKSQFLGVVVHDLRNPLNGILLAADLISEADDLEETRDKAAMIMRRVSEMNALIGKFLDIAALDAGQLHPEPETVSLRSLVTELVDHHHPAAQKKGIAILAEFPPEEFPLYTDPKFLRVVLDNLLSNAVKFSPAGSQVRIWADHGPAETRIGVQDSGPGLTESDREKLFGRFVRLSARPTGGEKSTGLGLSIVKKMVDALGARIEVESQPGVGSTFRVILANRNG